jgi:hypothetical protein
MAAWAVLLITLLGVALGAVASFLSARLTDRNRWRREERLRWDTRRLECYTDFSAAIIRFISIVDRLAAGHGMPAVAEPGGSGDELAALSAAEAELEPALGAIANPWAARMSPERPRSGGTRHGSPSRSREA